MHHGHEEQAFFIGIIKRPWGMAPYWYHSSGNFRRIGEAFFKIIFYSRIINEKAPEEWWRHPSITLWSRLIPFFRGFQFVFRTWKIEDDVLAWFLGLALHSLYIVLLLFLVLFLLLLVIILDEKLFSLLLDAPIFSAMFCDICSPGF